MSREREKRAARPSLYLSLSLVSSVRIIFNNNMPVEGGLVFVLPFSRARERRGRSA